MADDKSIAPVPLVNNNEVQWCSNLLVERYNPGTQNGQEIFKSRTKELPEDKKYQVLSTEMQSIKKFLIGKSTSLRGIITQVPSRYNDDGSVAETVNLITQHQLADFETLKRQAHARYKKPVDNNHALPALPAQQQFWIQLIT